MKLAICSDIHLEFGPLPIENTEGSDVLILAGDIALASTFDEYLSFFKACSEKFKDVIYIMGNHEHYNCDITLSYDIIKDALEDLTNIHVLEDEVLLLDDYVFVGHTLWTDFNEESTSCMNYIEECLNDYRVIRNGGTQRLTPSDTLAIHKKSLAFLLETLEKNTDKKIVVVGHHAPSHNSVKPRYELDFEMNGGYRSKLDWVMEKHRNIKVWVHGHTHHEFDYMVGDTRVLCNPRGYVGWEREGQNEQPYYPLVVEV